MPDKQRSQLRRIASRAAAAGLFSLLAVPCIIAQVTPPIPPNPPNPDGPTMKAVNDVLGGSTSLLQQQDTGVLSTTYPVQGNNNSVPQIIPFDTNNSMPDQTPTINFPSSLGIPNSVTPTSTLSSSASGRMFNNANDVVITLTIGISASNYQPAWFYSYWNPATKSNQTYTVASQLEPNGSSIASKVVMGNFQGNLLSCPLLFVEQTTGNSTLWGMNIVTVPNVNQVDVIDPYGGGPQYSMDTGSPAQVPIVGSIVAGDFNQDGVDEIAALMSDGETVQIYTVNPSSLQITPSTSFKLPAQLLPGTLAAGRFGSDSRMLLSAVGQQPGNASILIYYIDPEATPITQMPTTEQPSTTYGGDPNYYSSTPIAGVIAHAAPIINWESNSSEQLVIGLQYVMGVPSGNGQYDTGFVWIGTFSQNPVGTFVRQGATDVMRENGCLLDMQVGNFNNMLTGDNVPSVTLPNGTAVDPELQLVLLENVGAGNAVCAPNYDNGHVWVVINSITVTTNPQTSVSSISTDQAGPDTSTEPDFGSYDQLQGLSLVTGDFEGRSLRLGTPEKIRISSHTQPELVIGMPPMHVDWINPLFLMNSNCEPNSLGPNAPQCIMNLTVKPYGLSTDRTDAFTSGYNFGGNSVVTSNRQASSSWGLAAKQTVGVTAKFGVPAEMSSKVSVSASVGDAYKNVSSSYKSSYTGFSDSLTSFTGFDDSVFFTTENQNIYNYPILGQSDSQGNPLYASFSIPSSVQYSWGNGSTQEWYQPVHEPGNVLSYPSSMALLGQEHPANITKPLADSGCLVVGSASNSQTIGWSSQNGTASSAGWSDTLSENLNISVSTKFGLTVLGAGGSVKVTEKTDLAGEQSWSTLNQSSETLTSAQAFQMYVPQFDKTYASQFGYPFEAYVFGVINPATGSGADGITGDGTYQGNLTPANNANPPNQQTTGPMYIGYIADPLNSSPGLSCGETNTNWWTDAYNLPDVGFNHPNRWDASTANVVTFNNFAAPSQDSPIIDQPFYQMKGMWITPAPQAGDASVGSTIQSATAGDEITLTARVYNFSAVATTSTVPDSTVHVRFYGQTLCNNVSYPNSTGTVKDVCPGSAFLIPGSGPNGDNVIDSIPGFDGSGTSSTSMPNWALSSVNFDTTGYDGDDLVFWVVTWIEDTNGNVVPEIPDHGITVSSFTGKTFTDISGISLQAHSNNVGMYGTYSPFYVVAASSSSAVASATAEANLAAPAASTFGPLKSISLSLRSRKLLLDQKARVGITFQSGDSFDGSPVAYYDGEPGQGGKLFDFQTLHELGPDSTDDVRVFFRPQSCGEHTLYAVSSAEGFSPVTGKISAHVTVDPVAIIDGMITAIRGLGLQSFVQDVLLDNLRSARKKFREGEVDRGLAGLKEFSRLLGLIPLADTGNLRSEIQSLTAQTQSISTCAPTLREEGRERAAR